MDKRATKTASDWSLLTHASTDPAALSELFSRHRDFAYRLIYSRIGDHHAAEDITQELFISIAGRKRRFYHGAKFRTWLYRVASNRSIDYMRKHKRDPVMPLDESRAGSDSHDQTEQQSELDLVLQAIRRLPRRQQEVAVLRLLEGLSTEETASHLSISSGSVKTHLHRAQHNLRQALKPAEGETP